jgi:hypothetical protein
VAAKPHFSWVCGHLTGHPVDNAGFFSLLYRSDTIAKNSQPRRPASGQQTPLFCDDSIAKRVNFEQTCFIASSY